MQRNSIKNKSFKRKPSLKLGRTQTLTLARAFGSSRGLRSGEKKNIDVTAVGTVIAGQSTAVPVTLNLTTRGTNPTNMWVDLSE